MSLKYLIHSSIIILGSTLISCESNDIEKEVDKVIADKEKRVKSVPVQQYYMDPNEIHGGCEYQYNDDTDAISDEELLKKWTWNEEINKPSKSSITNTAFDPKLLLKEWSLQKDKKPILQITEEYFDVLDLQYIYTVNYDSIRIFTGADHPGGGIDRGIIKLINEDTLTIVWSTNDINIYISSSKK